MRVRYILWHLMGLAGRKLAEGKNSIENVVSVQMEISRNLIGFVS